MRTAAVVRCLTADCVVCGAEVWTCDGPESCPPEHAFGGQLSGGGWVCSEACWEAAMAWPRPMDRALATWRVSLAFLIFAGAFVYFRAQPLLPVWLALALAFVLAASIVSALLLAEAVPAKGRGRSSGGRK